MPTTAAIGIFTPSAYTGTVAGKEGLFTTNAVFENGRYKGNEIVFKLGPFSVTASSTSVKAGVEIAENATLTEGLSTEDGIIYGFDGKAGSSVFGYQLGYHPNALGVGIISAGCGLALGPEGGAAIRYILQPPQGLPSQPILAP